jgi:hypothetical protein
MKIAEVNITDLVLTIGVIAAIILLILFSPQNAILPVLVGGVLGYWQKHTKGEANEKISDTSVIPGA